MPDDVTAVRADAHWNQMIDQCCGRTMPACSDCPQAPLSSLHSRRSTVLTAAVPGEREVLCRQLPRVAQLLTSRRADLLPEQDIERYVTLGWLEWHGGTLRLTTVGRNLCTPVPGLHA